MVDFNVALIKKIVRLLESNHDGERAAAAGKLNSMAKDKGKNIGEMLAAVYGGGARASESVYEQPRRRQSSWGDEWGGTGFKDSAAQQRREAEERHRRAQRQEEGGRQQAREDEARARRKSHYNPQGGLLEQLRAQVDEWGTDILTPWEREFVESIPHWCSNLTTKQEASVAQILEKYAAYAKRNGEAEEFWKA